MLSCLSASNDIVILVSQIKLQSSTENDEGSALLLLLCIEVTFQPNTLYELLSFLFGRYIALARQYSEERPLLCLIALTMVAVKDPEQQCQKLVCLPVPEQCPLTRNNVTPISATELNLSGSSGGPA